MTTDVQDTPITERLRVPQPPLSLEDRLRRVERRVRGLRRWMILSIAVTLASGHLNADQLKAILSIVGGGL